MLENTQSKKTDSICRSIIWKCWFQMLLMLLEKHNGETSKSVYHL